MDTPAGERIIPVVSAAPFVEPLRQGIHEFKYNGVPGLAEPFARLMADAWAGASAAAGLSVDLIVPVPLHAARLRERGFNQSERLAFFISRAIGAPMKPRALARIRHTEHQARLGPAERRRNVQGAFAADESLCAGRRVLLVDDVLTTGTTLCECAAALLAAGAEQVSALTLARAGDRSSPANQAGGKVKTNHTDIEELLKN
ncbi:MAG: ComF family protein [Candidatus Roseilinea sp.]|uniref:ComF family protein n=1 Tax=Candidatus Roseilinea sp. TaxID=2838777 RepID=UPI0040493C9C